MNACLIKSYDFSDDACDVFRIFYDEEKSFFLDSNLYNERFGRYSFIGFDPFLCVTCESGEHIDLYAQLRAQFDMFQLSRHDCPTPFPAGIVGFISYDYGLLQERITQRPKDGELTLAYHFAFYDSIITVDHQQKKLHITSSGFPEKDSRLAAIRARDRLEMIDQKLSSYRARHSKKMAGHDHNQWQPVKLRDVELSCDFTKTEYLQAINKIKDYIHNGDVYQINLSQRFQCRCDDYLDPFAVYETLRRVSPASFGGYLNGNDFQLISNSPEQFLSYHNGVVGTRPMKGTRPRSASYVEDQKFKQALNESEKEKAELLMITDLQRNDLGRVCEFGSVDVKTMRTIEEYRYVYQATSAIEGTLKQGCDQFDLLKACFPGGSITGCPKIRAMQIIEEIEKSRRGFYTGSMGYISFTGDMDFDILIRTLLITENKVTFHVGGGIVADSDPQQEYDETLLKARAITVALESTAGLLK